MLGAVPETQWRNQFGLWGFHWFLFLFDGDAREARYGAGGEIGCNALLPRQLSGVVIAHPESASTMVTI